MWPNTQEIHLLKKYLIENFIFCVVEFCERKFKDIVCKGESNIDILKEEKKIGIVIQSCYMVGLTLVCS